MRFQNLINCIIYTFSASLHWNIAPHDCLAANALLRGRIFT
jgi:hypothetical protein